MRRFELKDGSSNKFWEVAVLGDILTVRFGKIGTNGQTQAKPLASEAKARAEHDKLVAEKQKKGYREVLGDARAGAPDSPLETGIVPALLELGQSMLERVSQIAVWRGEIAFSAGGVAKWRDKPVPWREEKVGAFLDRVALLVSRGESFLDMRIEGDVVEIEAWEWRDDWELTNELEFALQAAAPLQPKGSLVRLSRSHDGSVSRVTHTFAGKNLEVEEDDDDAPRTRWDKDKNVKTALAAIAPRLGAWLDAHPETRERVERSKQSGYIDRTGREIIPPRFTHAYEFSDGLAVVYDGWKAHFIDVEGRLMPGFYQGADAFKRGLAPVAIGDSDHWGYVDKNGEVKVKPTFTKTLPFYGPLAMVQATMYGEGRWMSPDGELVGDSFGWYPREPKCHFADGRVWTAQSNLQGFGCLDEAARPAIARRFYNVMSFSEGLAAVIELGGEKWGYVDRAGNIVIEPRFDEAFGFVEGRAVVRVGKKHQLIDRGGAFVGDPFESNGLCAKELSEGMIPFAGKNGLGFLDKDGVVAVPPRFEWAYGFFDGRAYVAIKVKRKGRNDLERWGHIDRRGEYVVEPTLEWTNRYRDGLAPVKVGKRYGFIDTEGKIAIEPRYAQMQPLFVDGRAWATLP